MTLWWRLISAVLVASVAAGVAAWADSKPLSTVVWAAICGIGAAFSPTLWERSKQRAADLETSASVAELLPGDGLAQLLHPSRRVVPFQGREQELSELLAWCHDAEAGQLRLVTGPGGVGKSRLAIELGSRLAGWAVVEVRDDAEGDALSKWRSAHEHEVLMVVDYAETRTDLAALLQEVAAAEGRRVRVLLLARSAGEWWQRLGGESVRVRRMISLAGQGIHLAEDIRADSTNADEVRRSVPYFAAALQIEPPQKVEVNLGNERPRILDLHAAALVAVLRFASSGGTVVRVNANDVLEELLGHEKRYWLQSARVWEFLGGGQGLSPNVIERMVAAGTLLGARDCAQAIEVVERVPGRPAVLDAGRVAEWLRELYPPADDGEWLGRLRPDRLAELHVTRQLSNSPKLLNAWMEGVDERQRRQALVMLARAAQELEPAGEILQRLLPKVADEIGGLPASRDTLVALYKALPYPSLALADARVLLVQRLVDSLPADTDPGERAYWLSALSVHVTTLGRLADALSPAEDAITIYRELATASPDRYRPEVARTLINVGVTFSGLGRPIDAYVVEEEATAIYRDLATAYPDRYRPDLADSLTNLSITLKGLGHPAEALPLEEEAVTIYRELAATHPDRYRPDLARACTNRGATFLELGHPAEALPLEEEAVTIYRELAATHPDRYRPDLARACTYLGVTFLASGCPAEALPLEEEAVTIYRELAAAYPDRYRPNLADSLVNLGIALKGLGRPTEAISREEEAAAIYQELAAAYPDRYRSDLASSLICLGSTLKGLGRPAEAFPLEEEAVTIYRELAATYPDRYRPDLANALISIGVTFPLLGRPTDAFSVEEEAVTIYRELAATHPDRYRSDLAQALTNHAVTFSALDDAATPLSLVQEAVAIYRELAATHPDRYRPGLAHSLVNFGNRLAGTGDRPVDALDIISESINIYRELVQKNPSRYRSDLANALINYTSSSLSILKNRLATTIRHTDILSPVQEAVTIYRELAQENPDRYHPELARALTNLTMTLIALGKSANALPYAKEAVDIYQELIHNRSEHYHSDHIISLSLLVANLSRLIHPNDTI